jgi:hypothetical protein
MANPLDIVQYCPPRHFQGELTMTSRILFLTLLLASAQAFAAKPCEELKGEIATQIDANHVPSYTLEIVANDQVGDRTVVGSCDGGTNKIVYTRGAAPDMTPPAAPEAAAPAAPAPAEAPAAAPKK